MATVFGLGSRRGSVPGCARNAYFGMLRDRHTAFWASFRMTALDERIAPLAQRWNVDIDPVIPPVDRTGIVTEIGVFAGWKCRAQLLDVNGFENVIVVQDERFEER